jgi:Tfp pilus assembly protein PilX
MRINKLKNKNGSALAYCLIIMTVVLIILVSMLQYITSQVKNSEYQASREEAFQIAESGINFYQWYLAYMTSGETTQQIQSFWQNQNPLGVATSYTVSYKDTNGNAIGYYKLTVTPPVTGSTIVNVTSVGWTNKYPNATRTIQVRLRRPSWSEFMVLSNDMFRLSSNTQIYGKLFANSGIHFDGVAHNTVSSAVSSYYDTDYNQTEPGVWTSWANGFNTTLNSNVFLLGTQFPVASQDFNSVLADFSYMKTQSQTSAGKYFAHISNTYGRQIILNTNGTFDTCAVSSMNSSTNEVTNYLKTSGHGTCSTCSGQCDANYTIPNNGVIFVEDNVWIQGQINGKKVSVVAADLTNGTTPDIYLKNNVLYTNYNGNDILGLVAENDIEITQNSADTLEIDGALLAQQGRVGRDDYGNTKTTITVKGSIVSNGRINFGYTDGTGYTNRNLYFDNDLLYYPPPYFPTGTDYQLDLWQEK